jgi:GNAT superfamily N-acetyltransferase
MADAPDRFLLRLTDTIAPELRQVIDDGLDQYNVEQFGPRDSRPLAVSVVDRESGRLLGGLFGHTSYGVLFIDLVNLPERARGQGIGTRVMAMVEDEARRRGCSIATLYTMQAPAFYERLGYQEFGRVEPDQGQTRIYLKKRLG